MGEKNVKFTLAKCCMPIPGDDIMGIVVIGKGSNILFSKSRYDDILFLKLDGIFNFFDMTRH